MPDAVKLALSAAVRQIGQADIRGVRTVWPDGIHLTLKFLGDIEAGRVSELAVAARTVDRARWRSRSLGPAPRGRRARNRGSGVGGGQPGVPTSPDAGSGPRQCNFRGQAPRLGGALGIEDSGGTANTWQSCEFNAHDIHATRRSSRRVVFRVVARKLTL